MKINKKTGWYVFAFLLIFALEGCNGRVVKQEKGKGKGVVSDTLTTDTDPEIISDKEDSVTRNVLEPKVTVQKRSEQSVSTKDNNISRENIDLNKIYEQKEVSEAILSISNSQLGELYQKNFKYPDIKPINGNGYVDLVIETDGSVSDVIIIKGFHPELDKEFIRVMMLLPKFIPGKISGIAVRSKLRLPILSRYTE